MTFTSPFAIALDDAQTESYMKTQQEACAKNTAMEWSATLNRCVGKQAARETRHASQDCNEITDLSAREKCHIALSEKNTGLSSDPSKLSQGKTTNSMVMNSITTAYTIINIISAMGKNSAYSNCTSKKIFGVTSVAGLASDVYLKMRAKSKVKELEDKFKLDQNSGSHEAQVKALEYLKEEQKTVVSIASLEKKRNLALMLGYGLAAGWAVYEMTPYSHNPDCYRPAGQETGEAKPDGKEIIKPATSESAASSAPTTAPANSPVQTPTKEWMRDVYNKGNGA